MRKFLCMLVPMLFLTLDMYGQGSTTASIRGRVVDNNGEAIPGANILATHTPTGTSWGNVTDVEGYYRIPNVNVGGPYRITVSFVGFETKEQNDIFLSLGQTYNANFEISEGATELEAIVVSAGTIFDGNRTGAATYIGPDAINSLPNVGRSVGDFVRLTPQAKIEEGNDGLEISVGGMNNRYNAIYVDGAVNNDVFGLAASGTNGGQTGVTPISIDAIEQFVVNVAPFDVRQSGFAGGSISAVTRSGTNEFEGSIYSFFRNEGLAGKTPAEDDASGITREKLPEFTARTTGFRIGGPIIQNKLFFFASGEIQRDETPQPFNLANYDGDATQADIDQLVSFLQSNYNYNPGTYTNNTAFLDSDKFLVKLDWNATKNTKITLRHSYTKAENLEARSSSGSGIRFRNGSEYFVSNTNSSALEIKTAIGNSMSNHFTFGTTIVRDDRDPFGQEFPAVFIDDGRGSFSFGAETFSTANLLDQDIITITNNFEYYKGKHSFLIGANLELYKTRNLFIPFNFGDYDWDRSNPVNGVSDLNDFLTGVNPDFFIRSYSLRDNVTGDESAAGITFSGSLFGFYVQDEFQASNNLKLTFGLRADINFFEDTPVNASFNTTTIPLLEAEGYDLMGAEVGSFIDPQFYFSPRLGFNYDVTGDRSTQIRGGIGIFTSRIPLVWPGGAYNNNGVNRGTYLSFGSDPFEPDINNQPPGNIDTNNPTPSGDVDIFARDFKIPQVWKANIGIDQKLPFGLIGGVEFLITKFINQVYYQNVNLKRSVANLEGTPDQRAIFDRGDEVDPTYGRIMLGFNDDQGYASNFTVSLTKPMERGFMGSLSYSYGDAWSIYDGTSSQNSSQWRGLHAINGRNFWNETGRSDFAQGHRILANFSYRKEYLGFAATQISMIYEGQSGNLYSYIYGSGDDITNEDSRNRELVYIPASQEEIVLVDNGTSPAEQWSQLDAFIEADDYLSEHRGEYAVRNSNRTPFEGVIDLKVLQDFYIEMANGKRNTLQISLDIFNFTNMLNKDWGKRYGRTSGGYELLEFEGFAPGSNVPTYSFTPFNGNKAYYGDLDDSGLLSSRWQMQFGIRYIFN